MSKLKRYKIFIYVSLGWISGLFPVDGFSEMSYFHNSKEYESMACIDETTDVLLSMRNFVSKLVQKKDQNFQYQMVDHVFKALLEDYEAQAACHASEILYHVQVKLQTINLTNQKNAVDTLHFIDELLIAIYQKYPDIDNPTLETKYEAKSFETVSKNDDYSIERNAQKPFNKTLDDLSCIVKGMLDDSVKLISDVPLRKDRLVIEKQIHEAALRCIQKGDESDHPVLVSITHQLFSIQTENSQIIETIQFLDHTLRIISCLKNTHDDVSS